MKIDNFFAELKRRNLYELVVAYAIIGWLIRQGAVRAFPSLGFPNGAIRLVNMLLARGFPRALNVAWAFELTSEGVKQTSPRVRHEKARRACFNILALGECGYDSAPVAPAHFRQRGDFAFQGDALAGVDASGTTAPLLGLAEAVNRPARGS